MPEKIPAEKKDEILKSAYSRIESYSDEGRDVDKYSVDIRSWLEDQPEVSKATLRSGNTITVEFEDSTRVGILLDRDKLYGGEDRYPRLIESVRVDRGRWRVRPDRWPVRPDARWWVRAANTPSSTNALLFDPLYDDWPPDATTDDIETALTNAGYTVTKMLSDDGDLAHLETIESNSYGVIFIRSHGGILVVDGNDKIHIMVRPFFDSYPDPNASGYHGIDVFYVGTNWGPKYAYAFNEEFVRHHLAAANFPNTVMHLLVCHGGDPVGQDDLIDAFLDFGVGAYIGWTRNASSSHGDPAAVEFFEYLCGAYGRTVEGAIQRIEDLGHSPDPITGAELVCYGSAAMQLRAWPVITVRLTETMMEKIEKFPEEFIEIVVEPPKGIKIPDWSPIGGKLTPVDRLGRRRFIPEGGQVRLFDVEEAMQEAVEGL